ncbi:MAG: hypothetical protein ACE5LB_01285 [Acidiferrobacterales bacterium]
MGNRTATEIVDAYLDALEGRDFDRARTYLSSESFSFRGPIASFNSADDFILYCTRVGPILEAIERRKTFVNGDEVCHILNFITRMSVRTTTPVVQWAQVERDKIIAIEVFFDAQAYARFFDDPTSNGYVVQP